MKSELSGLNAFLTVIRTAYSVLETTCQEELNSFARTTTGYGKSSILVPVDKRPEQGALYVLETEARHKEPQIFLSFELSLLKAVVSNAESAIEYILTPGLKSVPSGAKPIAPGLYVVGWKKFYSLNTKGVVGTDKKRFFYDWTTAKPVGAQTVEWYARVLKELRAPQESVLAK